MTCVISEPSPYRTPDDRASVGKTVGELSSLGCQDSVAPGQVLSELTRWFDADSSRFAVVVWGEFGIPRAIVSRDALARLLARPFAAELYKHRPVETLLGSWAIPVLAIPITEPIDKAVASALARPAPHRYEPVLVQGEATWFLLETHVLLAQQCEVLSAVIDEVDAQRRAILAAQQEREHLHEQLVSASRDAGRAEVATGVLHNVGNVLNSVNASASLMARTLQQSKLGNLGKALAMIREHENDLGDFLTADEKGQRLPAYLIKLAEVLAVEQTAVVDELQSMERSIDHIRQVVQMQQSYARSTVVVEPIRPVAVMEDAIRVNLVSFDRHNVKLQREFQDIGPVAIDKHKILQILINLINNAKNATKNKPPEERHIVARILSHEVDGRPWLRFQIEDNGTGITTENLTKIFSNGFTTRKDGHGFGLHSSANAAREMKGTLAVASDGPGQGAVFTLDVPIVEKPTA